MGLKLLGGGIIATTSGPHFETPADIRALKLLGANLVSMTAAPEVILSAESGLKISCVCIASNYAAGISKKPLTFEEVMGVMKEREEQLKLLIESTIQSL